MNQGTWFNGLQNIQAKKAKCMVMNRIVIFSGGTLGTWALEEVKDGDVLVGADRGALFLIQSGLRPHISLGDFDSVTVDEREVVRHGSQLFQICDPVMKDWTDTEMAYRWAMEQQPDEIVIVGALGTRFDHSLANVHLLWKAHQDGIRCAIIDQHNKITLIEHYGRIERSRFKQVSLLPLGMEVTGVTLEGFQYPLNNATLRIGDSIGVSNVLTADTGHIHIANGPLLCIQSID